MKKTTLLLALTTLVCHLTHAPAQEPPTMDRLRLALEPRGSTIELSWPATVQAADGQRAQPFFELQGSTDLKSWQPLGERLRAAPSAAGVPFQVTVPADQPHAFYRLLTSLPRTDLTLATTGAEVFGYGAAFARELQRIGQISPQEFAAMFPSGANYVPGISWDPTTASFWAQFNADPDVVNQGKSWGDPGYRTFDYRLNGQELAVFANQGFVVSEGLGSGSFADVFYNLWHNDLPVFISTDAILQAWHRTYDAMLEELEETYVFNSAEKFLAGMAAQVSAASAEVGNGVLHDSLLDADYFLAVARSFLVFGQKFVPDSWAFSQTVFDSISWNGEKVNRRVPSALDAAFAVLGNNQVVPDLVTRITNTGAANSPNHAERWRDGLPYQHNLAAARAVIDAQEPAAGASSNNLGWLAALRELSAPTTESNYPEAMRTRAWSMKTLNTQLASWTQLRHDTILYAKQSYGACCACFYPAGFVEPRVGFWHRLRRTVLRTAELISALPYEGTYKSMNLSVIQSNQVAHLRNFADTLTTLQSLSEKELTQQCFSADEELFIRTLIQDNGWLPWGCEGVRRYDGWYPRLFYNGVQFSDRPFSSPDDDQAYFQENFGVNAMDQIVADVHTDVPAENLGDPGSVLHEGIGRVNLLMIAVENGPDRMVFAGPVLSHYEFEVTGPPRRLNDNEWTAMYEWHQLPPDVESSRVQGLAPPPWTSGYLVPR